MQLGGMALVDIYLVIPSSEILFMFYYNHKGVYVLLTGKEEMELVRKVTNNPSLRIGYHWNIDARREVENLIFKYLKKFQEEDFEGYEKKYVFRSWIGSEAKKYIKEMVNYYSAITWKGGFGLYDNFLQLESEKMVNEWGYLTAFKTIFPVPRLIREVV